MFRIKSPRHFIYSGYGIMKETQEPDKTGSGHIRITFFCNTGIR